MAGNIVFCLMAVPMCALAVVNAIAFYGFGVPPSGIFAPMAIAAIFLIMGAYLGERKVQ